MNEVISIGGVHDFVLFEGRRENRSTGAAITVRKDRKAFYLNAPAYRLLSCPAYIAILFDRTSNQIAFRPEDKSGAHNYAVQGVTRVIAAVSFISTFNLQHGLYLGEMIGGMMVFSMTPEATP